MLGEGTDSLSHFVVALTLMLIPVGDSYSERMPGSLGVDKIHFSKKKIGCIHLA